MAIRRSLHRCFLLPSAATPPIARLVMSKRPESFIPWPLAHLPRPVAFAPRQSSSLSREPPAGRVAYSSEPAFAQKVQPKQGFITRMKAEPYDQITGDYCDLFSRWVKEWQSHRRARWKCGSQKLDVAPSRLATSSSPDQRDNGGGENSRSIPTMTHTIRQVHTHPCRRFFTGDSRLRRQFRYGKA